MATHDHTTPTHAYVPAPSPATVTFHGPTGPRTGHLLGAMHFRGEVLYYCVVASGELYYVPPAWLDRAGIAAPARHRRLGDLVGARA